MAKELKPRLSKQKLVNEISIINDGDFLKRITPRIESRSDSSSIFFGESTY